MLVLIHVRSLQRTIARFGYVGPCRSAARKRRLGNAACDSYRITLCRLPVYFYSLVHSAMSTESPSSLSTIPVIIPPVMSTVLDGISVIAIARDSSSQIAFVQTRGFRVLKIPVDFCTGWVINYTEKLG